MRFTTEDKTSIVSDQISFIDSSFLRDHPRLKNFFGSLRLSKGEYE